METAVGKLIASWLPVVALVGVAVIYVGREFFPVPGTCTIKGNISAEGEGIYHVPGGEYYILTRINTAKGERWFCTEAEARAAGWRRSRR